MYVSDELMGKLLKDTNIATKDVTDDEIHDRSVRFVKWLETLKNEGKWEDTDKSGAEYYFLTSSTFTRWMRRSSIRCSVQYTMVQSLGMTTAGS